MLGLILTTTGLTL